MINKYNWNKLNSRQLGSYAEYFAKMEFSLYGFSVFEPQVDDRGIDFVIFKNEKTYYAIQVKSVRGFKYIYFSKKKFRPRENLFAVIILFFANEFPYIYLIPSLKWHKPNKLFRSRDYIGKKSRPEWGLNLSFKKWAKLPSPISSRAEK